MPAARRTLVLAAALALALGVAACSGGAAEEREKEAARQREWAWLQATQKQLAAQRGEIAALRRQLLAAPVRVGAAPAGEPAPGSRADLEARLLLGEEQLRSRAVEFGQRLAAYVNGFPTPLAQPSPQQQLGIRMKSDEDIAVAQEWIDKGGDYRRAIEIYETQLLVDPTYPALQEALARAQQMRHVDLERFAKVTAGMTPTEVRDVLGPVNLHNAHEYPEQKLLAWYYPREGGGAAGVFFKLDEGKEAWVVYQATFEAQRTGVVGGDDGPRAVLDPASSPAPPASPPPTPSR